MIAYPHWILQPESPADACRLLGLAPGERDAGRIEEAAIACSAEARRYQLSYPVEATRRLDAIARAADELLAQARTMASSRRNQKPAEKKPATVLVVTQEDGESIAWELKPRRLRLAGGKPARGNRLVLLGADGRSLRLRLSARSVEQLGALLNGAAAVSGEW
jgi:hypothetical protein